MPLHVCENCNSVENLHCIRDKSLPAVYNFVGDVKDFFPNMHQMDMQGYGYKDEDIIVNGVVWKRHDEIKMLCSACNTGKWHDEFSRDIATEEELEMASHSKHRMITPFDHDIELIADDDTPHGYRLATVNEKKTRKNVKTFLAGVTAMFPGVTGMINKSDLKDKVIELTDGDKDRIRKAADKRMRKLQKKGL